MNWTWSKFICQFDQTSFKLAWALLYHLTNILDTDGLESVIKVTEKINNTLTSCQIWKPLKTNKDLITLSNQRHLSGVNNIIQRTRL